mmetsp:Transcript_15284/g.26201  ORF Transcript_15284/g.26201 Transcript_15284/m.26201 type:complete len:203 (-) Transcript_15284:142-750(-)
MGAVSNCLAVKILVTIGVADTLQGDPLQVQIGCVLGRGALLRAVVGRRGSDHEGRGRRRRGLGTRPAPAAFWWGEDGVGAEGVRVVVGVGLRGAGGVVLGVGGGVGVGGLAAGELRHVGAVRRLGGRVFVENLQLQVKAPANVDTGFFLGVGGEIEPLVDAFFGAQEIADVEPYLTQVVVTRPSIVVIYGGAEVVEVAAVNT